jgi:hypothetical protein
MTQITDNLSDSTTYAYDKVSRLTLTSYADGEKRGLSPFSHFPTIFPKTWPSSSRHPAPMRRKTLRPTKPSNTIAVPNSIRPVPIFPIFPHFPHFPVSPFSR